MIPLNCAPQARDCPPSSLDERLDIGRGSEGRRSDVLGADGMESGTVAGLVIPFSSVVTHIHAVLALAPVGLTRVPVGEPLIHS